MLRAARFNALCAAFPGAVSVPHMERLAWRTKARIFATVAADERSANLMLLPDQQEGWCAARPDSFAPVPGGWGRMGATTVTFATASEVDVQEALADAYARAVPKTKSKRGKKA